MSEYLTVKEVASMLQVHTQTIYKWVRNRLIPYVNINGQIRFKREDIEGWIKKGSSKAHLLLESFSKVDLALDKYDKLFLKGVRMSQEGKTWNYPFGSVYLRLTKSGKERWYIYYRVDGRRIREVVKNAQSRADALKALQVKVADAFRGRYGFKKEERKISFTDFTKEYIEKYAKVNKRSWKDDFYITRTLKCFFGSIYLNEIGVIERNMVVEY